MSKQYSLTSKAFTGEVILEFNEQGSLIRYDASKAELDANQLNFIAMRLPGNVDDIKQLLGSSGTAKLTEIISEVTFDMFWNRYNDKVRSSKKKAEIKWHKMKRTDQIKAFQFIIKYEMNMAPGISKKYAETYLAAEQWNN